MASLTTVAVPRAASVAQSEAAVIPRFEAMLLGPAEARAAASVLESCREQESCLEARRLRRRASGGPVWTAALPQQVRRLAPLAPGALRSDPSATVVLRVRDSAESRCKSAS